MDNEQLVLLIKQGKTEYYTELWEQTEKLIRKLIYKMWIGKTIHHTVDFEDLLQCGYFALVLAVKYYEPEKNLKFTTFLSFSVKKTINEEISKAMSSIDENVRSLDKVLTSDDEDYTLLNTIEDEAAREELERIELTETQRIIKRVVKEALERLPEEQSEVIRLRYFSNKTHQEIGKCLNITADKVRQLLAKGMRSLRQDKSILELYDFNMVG